MTNASEDSVHMEAKRNHRKDDMHGLTLESTYSIHNSLRKQIGRHN